MLVGWHLFVPAARVSDAEVLRPLAKAALVSGFVAPSPVFVGRYRVEWLPVVAPHWAVFAGFLVSGLSLTAAAWFPWVALTIVLATAGLGLVWNGYMRSFGELDLHVS